MNRNLGNLQDLQALPRQGWHLAGLMAMTLLVVSLFGVSNAQGQEAFVHVADSGNSFLNVTQLDHPAVNGQPSARLIVTPNYNPDGGGAGVNNPHYIGVFYSSNRWSIINEDLALMPDGAAFNVLVAPSSRSFVHQVTEANTVGRSTRLDNPLLTGDESRFLVTHNRTPNGEPNGPTLETSFRSYSISSPEETWTIEVPVGETLPEGTEFNVFVADASFETFDHFATASNTSSDTTYLSHPMLDGNPDPLVWAYELIPFGPNGENYHPYAVAYDPTLEQWAIRNSDGANIAFQSRFVVGFQVNSIFTDGFESGDTTRWSRRVP
ncbi:MAG: hypothetical protein SX243_04175 [Acidobacteriota bacterium]|nr:hypothetical protein [Acidobacteriota bacterium]